jgi:hypothetical protein
MFLISLDFFSESAFYDLGGISEIGFVLNISAKREHFAKFGAGRIAALDEVAPLYGILAWAFQNFCQLGLLKKDFSAGVEALQSILGGSPKGVCSAHALEKGHIDASSVQLTGKSAVGSFAGALFRKLARS